MCRIVGGFELDDNVLKSSIESMRDTMISGGPDDCGLFVKNNVVLAHRRLSIIDLSCHSHQPFRNDRYSLVFNGEIYNYKEVSELLKKYGVDCGDRSDTEVLLSAFSYFGVSCVDYFDGMFAFVIYDMQEDILYLFRDRFGVKPLYYYVGEDCFLFSSELKALFAYPKLQKEVNKFSLSYFLEFGYIPAPHSILKNTYKVENGHYLVVDIKNAKRCNIYDAIASNKYYDISKFYNLNNDFCIDKFESILERSISLRMVSDVNVGVCLSGGVDSSLVCSVLKKCGYLFDTFSISFLESNFDESKYVKEVSDILGIKNHKFVFSAKDAQNLISELPFIYDEPFGDTSALPTLLLAQNIGKINKVALSADGGDELGFGYDRYMWAYNRYIYHNKFRFLGFLFNIFNKDISVNLLNSIGFNVGIDKFLRIKNQLLSKNFLEHYLVEITHFRQDGLRDNNMPILDINDNDIVGLFKKMSFFDIQNYLSEDILTKTDRASMYYSVEFREPLLGRELVEYMVSLKTEENLIIDNGNIVSGKKIFKKYLEKYLPKELVYRNKMGFGVPIEEWIKGDLNYLLNDINCKYFDEHYVKSLIYNFNNNYRVDFAKIWYLYVFSTWCKYWNIE